jgi:tripartite-type tricarboxylate transporter receptor subunit TctC
MINRCELVTVLGALAIPFTCCAQQPPVYPSKPVRLIVPYAAGGPVDSMARLLVPRLVDVWGQQVIIDNRAGANSIVGSEVAARAAPDGYNLVLISASFTVNATLYPKLPFDPIRDFTPIALVASGPGLLVTHPSLPVRNLKELIAFAKAKPGALSYGSAGAGAPTSHLGMELLKSTAGIDVVHVPYKSMAPALIDILGGQVQMGMPTINAVLPHIRAGRLRAIGVSSLQRSSTAPEVPTLAEAGMPGYEAINWFAILGPSGFPPAIAEKIYADTVEVLKSPELRERIGAAGMEPKSIPPPALAGYIKSEIDKWGRAVKASGAKPE